MFTVSFWTATAERALKTFAQTLLALAGASAVDLFGTSFGDKLAASAFAAVLSVLSSIASSKVGNSGPSLADEQLPG